MDKVIFSIDGSEVIAENKTTILQAALQNNIYIPHLCYHPDLKPSGVCRLCVVEVDKEIVFSCRTPVENGIEVKTRTPELDEIRRVNVELIVANHHITCRGCWVSGRCALQKVMAYIRLDRKRINRLRLPKEEAPVESFDEFCQYDPNKCVLCGICVHTCEEIQHALNFIARGYKTKIAFFGDSSKCQSCYQCISRCPVGALIPKEKTLRKEE